MTVIDVIKRRRSIRKYRPNAEISQEQVELLLEAAMLAPSAINLRPWEFIVIRDKAKLQAMMEVHEYAKMLETASLAIVVVGLPRNKEDGIEFFSQDCGAATQNILLQAVAMGLGTCWCGIYPIEKRVSQFKELLGVEAAVPYSLITVGIPDEQPAARGFYDPNKVKHI